MPDAEIAETPETALTDLNTKFKDLEERHNLLKEKVLLLGQSFLKQQEHLNKEISVLKDELKESKLDIDRTKEAVQHIIRESSDFARKEELKTLERFMKIWEPLRFVKEEEVKRMISEALKKAHHSET